MTTPTAAPGRPVLLRVVVALTVAVVLAVGLPAPSSGHAYLQRTDPADGSVVEQAPTSLSLYFSEHVVLDATTVDLVDSSGAVRRLTGLELRTDDADDTEVPSVVTAELPPLPRDAYRVEWATLSSDDLHRTSGYVVFGVGTSVTAAGFSEPAPPVGESSLRWLLDLGLGLALGSLLVSAIAAAAGVSSVRRRLVVAGRAGAVVAATMAVALLVDQVAASGVSATEVLTSGYGSRWLLREAGLLLLLAALARPAGRAWSAWVGGSAAAVGAALLGHAGADAGGQQYVRVAVTALHLLSVLTWCGAVACLALAVLPFGRGAAAVSVRGLLRRFAVPAVVLLGVGVATGVLLAGSTVATLDALLLTSYGRTLLVKVALVSLAAGLALGNHRRLRRRAGAGLPRGGVAAEALVAALAVGAAALLAGGQPATEPRFEHAPVATEGPVSVRAADLAVGLDVSPGVAGVNVVSVDVFDTRRPAPGEVTAVSVSLGDGRSLPATPSGDGHWTVPGVDLPAGARRLEVAVTRPGLPEAAVATGWTVGAGGPAPHVLVSDAPLRTPARLAALAVAAALVGGLLVARRRRRLALAHLETAATEPEPESGVPVLTSATSAGP